MPFIPRNAEPLMPEPPTTAALYAAQPIVEDDVMAIIRAYVANPAQAVSAVGEGYVIDVAAAVNAHPFAASVMHASWTSTDLRLAAVRAAVLLAQPLKL